MLPPCETPALRASDRHTSLDRLLCLPSCCVVGRIPYQNTKVHGIHENFCVHVEIFHRGWMGDLQRLLPQKGGSHEVTRLEQDGFHAL